MININKVCLLCGGLWYYIGKLGTDLNWNRCRTNSLRGTKKYSTKVCGTGTRNQWCLVPKEPETGGARYTRNQEPVVLGTAGYIGNQLLVVSLAKIDQ